MIFEHKVIRPFDFFGLTSDFWALNIDILIATWIAMALLLVLAIIGRKYLNQELSPLSVAYEKTISFFITMCKDSFPVFNYYYFAFITSLFFFTFSCCLVGVIPFVHEATADINTTFALGLTSFLYIQYQKIKVHGILGYLKEFTEPFFILAPIHVVGELSKIASMSFRLYGNVLGGGVILSMIISLFNDQRQYFFIFMALTLCIAMIAQVTGFAAKNPMLTKVANILLSILFLLTWIQIVLGIAEGLIQSFVLTMLTVTYLAMGTQHEEEHHDPA